MANANYLMEMCYLAMLQKVVSSMWWTGAQFGISFTKKEKKSENPEKFKAYKYIN